MRSWPAALVSLLLFSCGDPADDAADEGYCDFDQWNLTWSAAVSELRASEPGCTADSECTVGATSAIGRCGSLGTCGAVMHVASAKAWDPMQVGAAMCKGAPRNTEISCDSSPACAAEPAPVCRAGRCVPGDSEE